MNLLHWAFTFFLFGEFLYRRVLYRLGFEWQTTFFGRVPFGFYVMWYDKTRTNGQSIWALSWRSEDSIEDTAYIKTRWNGELDWFGKPVRPSSGETIFRGMNGYHIEVDSVGKGYYNDPLSAFADTEQAREAQRKIDGGGE